MAPKTYYRTKLSLSDSHYSHCYISTLFVFPPFKKSSTLWYTVGAGAMGGGEYNLAAFCVAIYKNMKQPALGVPL